ncbi:hypothetical protein AB6Q13_09350 [Ralstonia solanacearum]|uniref:hypothetical protein n=1 Tax=Ralstonia solanacearum TaxID=305 RepID=UPI0023059EE6|nr:hypothetical protein [Ralstonia solanacearum]MDB0567594.1 hypothetical protein [Ralstonia solanacearum]MDB0577413.1 hypothetical protein [Ralstonia solanacearum]
MESVFKIYCHPKEGVPEFEGGLLECADISIQGTPSEMKVIGEFLISCAERFATCHGDEIVHFHLSDEWQNWEETFADIVGASLPIIGDEK